MPAKANNQKGAPAPKPSSPEEKDNTPSPEEAAADLAAENEKLKEQLAAAEGRLARETLSPADEKLVEAKVAAGLSRAQATSVVQAQKKHDAAPAGEKG